MEKVIKNNVENNVYRNKTIHTFFVIKLYDYMHIYFLRNYQVSLFLYSKISVIIIIINEK